MSKILVTGCAGFIGFHFSKRLIDQGNEIVGIDNLNSYYDIELKNQRLGKLNLKKIKFTHTDLANADELDKLFKTYRFDYVIHLAAQAGVRYSIENPQTYYDSNITGFGNILECCRNYRVKHLIYASSSSVYGMNTENPFFETHRTDSPVSLYAATKKSNEVIAHAYSHLYDIPTTGLRFFTVYGTYGRPDMAYYKFTKAIANNEVIDVYNNGKMKRDFTHVSDICISIEKLLDKPPEEKNMIHSNAIAKYDLLNIGNNNPVQLDYFIKLLEKNIGKNAKLNKMPMQPGDVPSTYADISNLEKKINYSPQVSIENGLEEFVDWYLEGR